MSNWPTTLCCRCLIPLDTDDFCIVPTLCPNCKRQPHESTPQGEIMSSTTIWKCDRCNKTRNSDEHSNPLLGVKIVTGSNRNAPDFMKADWCEACRIETGIFRTPKVVQDNPDLPEPLGLEEMIREIVREEINDA